MSSKEDETTEDAKKTKRRKRLNGFEEWGGYMAAKKTKLEAQFQGQKPIELQNEQSSEIFKGISIYVNGYTKPPAEELKRLMRLHGGAYHFYYSHSKTTHIIASNLPNSKIKNLKKEIVVTADWIIDSIKAGKLLPTHEYLLYSPETKDKQQKLCFKNPVEKLLDNDPGSPDVNLVLRVTSELHCGFPKFSDSNDSFDEFISSPPCFESGESPSDHEEKAEHDVKCNQTEDIPKLVLAADPAASSAATFHTAGHPEFLSEFYNHSRLHHISTSGQELKRYVQYLLDHKKDFPGRFKLKNLAERSTSSHCNDSLVRESKQGSKKHQPVIMHLDMDCFFVSVGLRKHPELRGQPVAVTHSKGKKGGPQEGSNLQQEYNLYENSSKRKVKGLLAIEEEDDFQETKPKVSIYSKDYGSLSEIASCSYEARKAGLRNGMFLGEALRRCPNLKTIPYDFESYTEVSRQLYDIVSSYTLEIEAVSVDELYVDCTELLKNTHSSSLQFASLLRNEIFEKTKCTASAGLGSNMLLARLATKLAKPNGQYHVQDYEVEDFMKKQKVDNLPGVGYRTSKKLEQLGIVTCEDLQKMSLTKLQQEFGPKTGESVYNKCRGKDSRKVQVQKDRKSVSAEINYGIRFETNEDVSRFINELAVEVQTRLQNINCKGKLITLKLMVRQLDAPVETAKFMGHGVCDNMSKSVVLKSATDSSKLIGSECCKLATTLKINPKDYRGVGIQVSKLEQTQKGETSRKTMENFFCQDATSLKSHGSELKWPKKEETISKTTPEKNLIKDFLSKPYKRETYDLTNYIPEELDQSVLNALPEDLRKEILENCAKPSTSHAAVRPNKFEPLPSPISKSKDMPKKLRKISDFSESLSKDFDCQPSTSFQVPAIENLWDRNISNNQKYVPKPSMSSDVKKHRVIEFFITWGEKGNKTNKDHKSVNLGGAVETDDVRKLLKEWILNTQTPLDEDIEELKQFLLESIDQDLSKVSLLLKYFYRLASSHGPLWQEAYLSILSYVQQKMLQNYGAMLTASSDFPI